MKRRIKVRKVKSKIKSVKEINKVDNQEKTKESNTISNLESKTLRRDEGSRQVREIPKREPVPSVVRNEESALPTRNYNSSPRSYSSDQDSRAIYSRSRLYREDVPRPQTLSENRLQNIPLRIENLTKKDDGFIRAPLLPQNSANNLIPTRDIYQYEEKDNSPQRREKLRRDLF